MGESMVNIEWKEHGQVLSSGLWNYLLKEFMVDTNVTFSGEYLKVHRLILSIFLPTIQQYITDVIVEVNMDSVAEQANDVRTLVEFAYNGRVSVSEDRIEHLVRLAENLKFEGLTKAIRECRPTMHGFESSEASSFIDNTLESVPVKVEPEEPMASFNFDLPIKIKDEPRDNYENTDPPMTSCNNTENEIRYDDPLFRNWNDCFNRDDKTFSAEALQGKLEHDQTNCLQYSSRDVTTENTDSTSEASQSSYFTLDRIEARIREFARKPMTLEQREAYNNRRRIIRYHKYENETPEEREQRLERQRIQRQKSREAMRLEVSEYRERCRLQQKEYRNKILENETPEERAQRLAKQRMQRQRWSESKRRDLEYKEKRRIKQKQYRSRKRKNETPEEREQRLEKERLQRQKLCESKRRNLEAFREEVKAQQQQFQNNN